MASLTNPDYLLSLCKKFGLTPSKKYGQNYLLDPEVITTLLEAGEVTKNDTIVEVGSGFGVLTLPLAERAGKVISFEIEKKLAPYWQELIKKRTVNNLEIRWGNVLRSFDALQISSSYKVLANLPYQITSAVIRLFLEAPSKPEVIVCMVQKEVAERICAKPGNLSVLALSVQYYAIPKLVAVVPRSSFWPSPAVDSAVICLRPHREKPNDVFTALFFRLIKRGFAQKRKLLFKNLLPYAPKQRAKELAECLAEVGISPTARAQEVSLEHWKKLAVCLLERNIFTSPTK